MRLISGRTLLFARFDRYSASNCPVLLCIVTISSSAGLVLSTRTPFSSTTCGSSGSTRFTRLLTSTVARSRSVPGSNTTLSCIRPEDDEVDSMYSSPLTPFISRSSGAATTFSSSSGDAPG